jgi:hypothetical protein
MLKCLHNLVKNANCFANFFCESIFKKLNIGPRYKYALRSLALQYPFWQKKGQLGLYPKLTKT